MDNIFRFLLKYRTFLVFMGLELLCGLLIIQNNSYQNASFLASASHMYGYAQALQNGAGNFFTLDEKNKELQLEISRLRSEINRRDTLVPAPPDAFVNHFIPAKVADNSTDRLNNYVVLNKGSKDGIRPGMGVVSATGIVGKVIRCSENFSTVESVLSSKKSSSIRAGVRGADGKKESCTVRWTNPLDPRHVTLTELPRHVPIKVKDTVRTFGLSTVYPGTFPIGTISEIRIENDGRRTASVKLSENMDNVYYVWVIRAEKSAEFDSLMQEIYR